MLVRFWGTRGSLPAPLSARRVRDKLKRTLGRAAGRRFENDAAIEAFIDQELEALARPAGTPPLEVSSAYDGLEIRL